MADRSRTRSSPICDLENLTCSDSAKARAGLSRSTIDFPRRPIRQRPSGLKNKESSREWLITYNFDRRHSRGQKSVHSARHEMSPIVPGQHPHPLTASADDTGAAQIVGDTPDAVHVIACGRRPQQIALLGEPWHCHMPSRSPYTMSY